MKLLLYLACVWIAIKIINYFTIQFIFTIIHGSHCTFWYYSWTPLYYFNYLLLLFTVLLIISFQFQQNKQYLNIFLISNYRLNLLGVKGMVPLSEVQTSIKCTNFTMLWEVAFKFILAFHFNLLAPLVHSIFYSL